MATILEAAQHFLAASVDAISITPLKLGHIHQSWIASTPGVPRILLQQINVTVFHDPEGLMKNIVRVTSHLKRKGLGEREVLQPIAAEPGRFTWTGDDGKIWRAYRFIEDAYSIDAVATPDQARTAAAAFGAFQTQLLDLPAGELAETIPSFHDTPKRFQQFLSALEQDRANRAKDVRDEIAFALRHQSTTRLLIDANLPVRITHNDTKLNNLLWDARTHAPLCVTDLDTVMPGLSLCDFGDLIRTVSSAAAEDDPVPANVAVRPAYVTALAEGYLSRATFLTPPERELLVGAGIVITLETGLRFLTDYLSGDTYFAVHRPGHNRDRCRTQFALVEDLERQQGSLEKLIREIAAR